MKLFGTAVLVVCAVYCAPPMRADSVSPVSGHDMYMSYCASCHGRDGKGNGPVAASLKTAPADLTMLSARNNGQFPEKRVYGTIRGNVRVASHGSAEMPVWGHIFEKMGDSAQAQMRLSNLVSYLRSIQSK